MPSSAAARHASPLSVVEARFKGVAHHDVEAIATLYVDDAVQFTASVSKPDGSVAFEVSLANFLTVEHGRITRDETYFGPRGQPCA